MLREVKTENGIIRGLVGNNARITAFRGVPFAKPPVGDLRWKAPQPAENWDGVYEAYEFKNISMQDTPGVKEDGLYEREWFPDSKVPIGEDSLYLNIWTSAKTTDDKLPVLVWFHGGAFQWGYSYEMEFNGENLAKRGIVVVSVPYRMGLFGFFAAPELSKDQPEAPTNFGLLDQQAGLKWVKRNIKAFGGDPDKITIAGQSAGGASTMMQMVSPQNKGMIKSAIIQSGIINNPFYDDPIIMPAPLAKAEKRGVEFMEYVGVSDYRELKKMDAFELRAQYAEFAKGHERFVPCTDGVFLPDDPIKMFMNNDYDTVPLMAGNTEDEFQTKVPKEYADKPAYKEAISGLESAIKATFANKENCYYYRFTCDIPGEDNPGTFHSVDLWFFFETLANCWRPLVGRHYDLARQMCNYWANFIKTGNPNGNDSDGTPMAEWKPYSPDERNEMIFSGKGPYTLVDTDPFTECIAQEIIKKYR